MYILNVTFSLEPGVVFSEVKEVVLDKFLNELNAKKLVEDFQFLELIRTPHGEAENTFTCQVSIKEEANLRKIEDLYKPRFDHQLFLKYGERCLNFTTVLKYH